VGVVGDALRRVKSLFAYKEYKGTKASFLAFIATPGKMQQGNSLKRVTH
jgi:hypothetical protein